MFGDVLSWDGSTVKAMFIGTDGTEVSVVLLHDPEHPEWAGEVEDWQDGWMDELVTINDD